jgi:predicted transposase/invertase (TIGR01784 family)
MANHYDRIFKENIEPMIPFIARRLFGIEMITKSEDLKDKLQYTLEKEADYLQRIIHTNPLEDYILHVECQVKDDKEMLSRMLLYRAIIFHKFKLPVKQLVFYIGQGNSKMENLLTQNDLAYNFHLRDISQFNYENFIESNVPEEVLLAILANFEGENPEVVIHKILQRLQQLSDQKLRLTKYEKQLEILSKLRKLQKQTIQTIKQMGWEYELETDIRFLQGVKKGQKKGEQKGIATGIEKSKIEFTQNLLLAGVSDVVHISKLVGVSTEFVENVKKNLLEDNK